jgi:predicted MFS family arabinose efflux permease
MENRINAMLSASVFGGKLNTHSSSYAWYVAIVLMLCNTLALLDAKLPYIVIQSIKADLSLTDTQLGLIVGPVFALTFAVVGIPISKISDRYIRKYVIATAVVVWSGFTAAGGLAHLFLPFLMSRTGVALGESACIPAAHSMIADYFPERSRAKAIALCMAGNSIGSCLGFVLGGRLNDLYNWRIAMFAVGASGVFLTVLILLTVKEPRRNDAQLDQARPKRSIGAFFRVPAIRYTAIGATFLGFSAGAVAWIPAYIMRSFHLSASQTGAALGLLMGIVSVAGVLSGGAFSDWLSRRDPRHGFWFLSGSFVLAAAAGFGALLMTEYSLFLSLFALQVFLVSFYSGPTFATIQSLVHPTARSFASAIVLFGFGGIGLSGGAFLTGWLSDLLAVRFGSDSLRWAIMIIAVTPTVCAAFSYMAGSRHLKAGHLRRPQLSERFGG